MDDSESLPRGFRREAHCSLPSTNRRGMSAARSGDPGRLWVTAEVQTAGRGRQGRSWSTERGNLAASVLLVDPALPAATATLSFVAGVALHQAVLDVSTDLSDDRLKLKWPNDMLLDGGKVAGILLEGEMVRPGVLAVVIGFGVNCLSHPRIGGPRPAVDLNTGGVSVDAEILFDRLAGRFADCLEIWDRGAGFARIREAWLDRAMGIGMPITVRLTDVVMAGRFDGLDAAGRLMLGMASGESRVVSAGDVFFPTSE